MQEKGLSFGEWLYLGGAFAIVSFLAGMAVFIDHLPSAIILAAIIWCIVMVMGRLVLAYLNGEFNPRKYSSREYCYYEKQRQIRRY